MYAHVDKIIAYYNDAAVEAAQRLHDVPHEIALSGLDAHLPAGPFRLLDLGAGSGRDALWYAARGHRVTAVEPAAALREIGMRNTAGANVRWLDDALPDLRHVRLLGETFDVILLSAVWMFLPPEARPPALAAMATLLGKGGRIAMTVQSAAGARRELKYFTGDDEYRALAVASGLSLVACQASPDQLGRNGYSWQVVVLVNQ